MKEKAFELLSRLLRKEAWAAKKKRRDALPFFRRMFTPNEKDPDPLSVRELAERFAKEVCSGASVRRAVDESSGRHASYGVLYRGSSLTFVVEVKYYDGDCYHMSSYHIGLDGSCTDKGCTYPYSECGVSGVTDIIGDLDYPMASVIRSGLRLADEIRTAVQEILKKENHE